MSAERARIRGPSVRARAFVALQRVLPQHTLSRLVHRIARSRNAALKNLLIGAFVRAFRPRMGDAAQPDPLRYGSFNEFFTRALAEGVRRVDAAPDSVVSPVDGTISQIGYLEGERLLQAKGRYYALDALLGARSEWSEQLRGGAFATLYLAPYDYHRVHMPLAGRLRAAWYVPGRLFSVNATTVAAVSSLFARNERIVCIFEHDSLAFAVVLVGALCVGSMSTVWHGEVTPCRPRRALELAVTANASQRLEKGAEMGRFNMGSTVILVFPPHSIEWLSGLAAGVTVQVGQPLARLRGVA